MNHNSLNLSSTIERLSLYDFQIEINQLAKKIPEEFLKKPNLPGAVVTENGQLIGVISRKQFAEYMFHPYGLELFLNRPIRCLYDFIQTDVLFFSGNTSIVRAVQQLLERRSNFLEEPILVEIAPQVYKLLDGHQLLIAYSEIHLHTTQLITKLYQKLKTSNQQLRELVTIDGLTQLANRRRFDEYLTQEWKRAAREQMPISLLLGDLDFFKRYNDTYGHQAGDDCLRSCGAAIMNSVKRPADLAARYGGEEFVLVLPNTETNGAICVAQKIREKIAALKIVHAKSTVSGYITLSLGIATLIPEPNKSLEELILAADTALYEAKRAGRDRYVIYAPELETELDAKILSRQVKIPASRKQKNWQKFEAEQSPQNPQEKESVV